MLVKTNCYWSKSLCNLEKKKRKQQQEFADAGKIQKSSNNCLFHQGSITPLDSSHNVTPQGNNTKKDNRKTSNIVESILFNIPENIYIKRLHWYFTTFLSTWQPSSSNKVPSVSHTICSHSHRQTISLCFKDPHPLYSFNETELTDNCNRSIENKCLLAKGK